MQLALHTLAGRGRRRIGFCSSRLEMSRIGRRWLGGYFAWQREVNADNPPKPQFSADIRILGTQRGMAAQWRRMRDDFARWFERERPDAIVSNLSHIPLWLDELVVRVPDDVAFASLGREEVNAMPGIDQRSRIVGAAAFDLVSGQIFRNDYGLPEVPTTVLVPSVWRDGNA